MDRRNFLKLVGAAAVAPVVAIGCDPVVAVGGETIKPGLFGPKVVDACQKHFASGSVKMEDIPFRPKKPKVKICSDCGQCWGGGIVSPSETRCWECRDEAVTLEQLRECRRVLEREQDMPKWLTPELENTLRATIQTNRDYWAKKYYENALINNPLSRLIK